jgi:FkbM family methyltransferase
VLVQHRIDLLFDVGANTGQFAMQVREQGFAGRIVSFEPLPEAHAGLVRNARGDAKWIVHERVALGAAPGDVRINVAANSVSSSILPMLDAPAAAPIRLCGAVAGPAARRGGRATMPAKRASQDRHAGFEARC